MILSLSLSLSLNQNLDSNLLHNNHGCTGRSNWRGCADRGRIRNIGGREAHLAGISALARSRAGAQIVGIFIGSKKQQQP